MSYMLSFIFFFPFPVLAIMILTQMCTFGYYSADPYNSRYYGCLHNSGIIALTPVIMVLQF